MTNQTAKQRSTLSYVFHVLIVPIIVIIALVTACTVLHQVQVDTEDTSATKTQSQEVKP